MRQSGELVENVYERITDGSCLLLQKSKYPQDRIVMTLELNEMHYRGFMLTFQRSFVDGRRACDDYVYGVI